MFKAASLRVLLGFTISLLVAGPGQVQAQAQAQAQENATLRNPYFYYLTQQDRKKALKEYYRAVRNQYAFYFLKKSRIQLDIDAVFREALAQERAVPDSTDAPAQALANLQFYDRMQKLNVKFQDGHARVFPTVNYAPILLPLLFDEVDGKIVVSGMNLKLLTRTLVLAAEAEGMPAQGVTVNYGDEVTTINGKPALEVVKQMEVFAAASSPAARRSVALRLLTERSMAFPERGWVDLNFVRKDPTSQKILAEYFLRVPYFYRSLPRGDQRLYFTGRSFVATTDIEWEWDAEKRSYNRSNIDKYFARSSDVDLIARADYRDSESDQLAVTSGLVVRDGRTLGYLRLTTFNVAFLGSPKTAWRQVLLEKLKDFKARRLPLILDLRDNNGGRFSRADELWDLLSSRGSSNKAYMTFAYRTTAFNQLTLGEMDARQQQDRSGIIPFPYLEMQESFADAVRAGKPYTDSLVIRRNQISPELEEYDLPIFAWTGPDCISACDMTLQFLKKSKRATIIGQPTHGTGGGFNSVSMNTVGSDARHILSWDFPTMNFGKVSDDYDGHSVRIPDSVESLSTENEAVQPDVPYLPQLRDITTQSVGWVEKTLSLLSK